MSSPLCNPKFVEHLKQSKAKTKLRMHLKADRIIDRVYSQVLADLHLFFTFDHEVVTPREAHQQSCGEPPNLSPCTTQQHLIQSFNLPPLDVITVPNVSQNGDHRFDEFQVSIPRSIISTTKQSASLSEPINTYPTHQIIQHDNDMENSSSRDDSNEPEVKQEFDEAITVQSNSQKSNEKANEGILNEPMRTGLAQCLPSLPQPNGHVQLDFNSNKQFQGLMIKQVIDEPANFQLEPLQNDYSINSSSSTRESFLFLDSMLSTSTDQSSPNAELHQPQQQLVDIEHDQFDEEECDCDECVYGGFEVKDEEDDDDDSDGVEWIDDNQEDRESSLPAKRPRMDSTQQPTHKANPNEDKRPDEEGDQMGTEQTEVSRTQSTNDQHYDHDQYNSNDGLAIQENHKITNKAIEGQITNEFISNPIRPNLAQSNRHFQCPHCPKSFDLKCRLEQHIRVHTGERPFACDQCDKRFNHKLGFEVHLRTHSGERPFQCRFCEQSFADWTTRKRHEQAKHLHVKPYRCKVCGHPATTRSIIINHIRVIHFGLPQTIKEQRERNIIDDRDPKKLVEKVL